MSGYGRPYICNACNGAKYTIEKIKINCVECNGSGNTQNKQCFNCKGYGHLIIQKRIDCITCNGNGYIMK